MSLFAEAKQLRKLLMLLISNSIQSTKMLAIVAPSSPSPLTMIPKPPPPPPRPPMPRKCVFCLSVWSPYGERWPIRKLPCGSVACFGCLDVSQSDQDQGTPSLLTSLSQKWIDTQVSSGSLHIRCISTSCKHELDVLLSHRQETHRMHDTHLLHDTLSKLPDFVWCPRCPSGGLIPSTGVTSACGGVICDGCSFNFCLNCNTPAHGQIPCGESKNLTELDRKKLQDDRLSLAWKMNFTRECPQCHVCIERMEGCSHMTCSRCKYQFCWLCSQKYKGRHVPNGVTKCQC